MAEPKNIAAELRRLATGRVEWRVQDPADGSYCVSFDRGDSLNPERDAHAWLEDYKRRFPNGMHAHFEVAQVRVFTELEQAALEAAAAIEESGAVPNPAQLRTQARPDQDSAPCVPGRHCERHARGLGGCVAGHCNRPRTTAVKEAGNG